MILAFQAKLYIVLDKKNKNIGPYDILYTALYVILTIRQKMGMYPSKYWS